MRNAKVMMTAALTSACIGLGGVSGVMANDNYSDGVVRIGVLTDMSGIYTDLSGRAAVEAVRMAVEDFGGEVNGVSIEVVHADHRNRPDVGASRAREWYDTQSTMALSRRAWPDPCYDWRDALALTCRPSPPVHLAPPDLPSVT